MLSLLVILLTFRIVPTLCNAILGGRELIDFYENNPPENDRRMQLIDVLNEVTSSVGQRNRGNLYRDYEYVVDSMKGITSWIDSEWIKNRDMVLALQDAPAMAGHCKRGWTITTVATEPAVMGIDNDPSGVHSHEWRQLLERPMETDQERIVATCFHSEYEFIAMNHAMSINIVTRRSGAYTLYLINSLPTNAIPLDIISQNILHLLVPLAPEDVSFEVVCTQSSPSYIQGVAQIDEYGVQGLMQNRAIGRIFASGACGYCTILASLMSFMLLKVPEAELYQIHYALCSLAVEDLQNQLHMFAARALITWDPVESIMASWTRLLDSAPGLAIEQLSQDATTIGFGPEAAIYRRGVKKEKREKRNQSSKKNRRSSK